MNPIRKKAEVPFNLPHEKTEGAFYEFKIKIPKIKKPEIKINKKEWAKYAILFILIISSIPTITNNVVETGKVVKSGAEKTAEVFPTLTNTGKVIGSFVIDGTKNAFGTISENLALVANILYTKKITPEELDIINNTNYDEIVTPTFPTKIVIEKIGVNSIISNPESTDIATLDKALENGVVRYPKSGLLEQNDNIYLFGHSTGISAVRNQAYKALNGLNKLEKGDIIKVYSVNKEYVYKVTSVVMKKDSEAVVYFNTRKKTLTISTCNSLGNKEDRYIVEADFVTSYPVAVITPNTPAQTPTITPTRTTNTQTEPTFTAIRITPESTPTSTLKKVDLVTKITEVGIINSENKFVATTTLKGSDKIAFKFVVSNAGGLTASNWKFNVVLPTNPPYIYHSDLQKDLKGGEAIEFALGFDSPALGNENLIIVNVDPAREISEISEENNIAKRTIKVVQ